jgi:hypothetical protein
MAAPTCASGMADAVAEAFGGLALWVVDSVVDGVADGVADAVAFSVPVADGAVDGVASADWALVDVDVDVTPGCGAFVVRTGLGAALTAPRVRFDLPLLWYPSVARIM